MLSVSLGALPDDGEGPNLATLRERAEQADPANKREAWAAFWGKYKAEVARRDRMRAVRAAGAQALGKRVALLPGVIVESAEADDFGRAELRLTIDAVRRWTRPIHLNDARGYPSLRDAIAAHRRDDHRRARLWLSDGAPPRSTVRRDSVGRVRFGMNEYGWEWWGS